MSLDLAQLTARLEDSGLMTAEELSRFQSGLSSSQAEDVGEITRALVRQKRLTEYQVDALSGESFGTPGVRRSSAGRSPSASRIATSRCPR